MKLFVFVFCFVLFCFCVCFVLFCFFEIKVGLLQRERQTKLIKFQPNRPYTDSEKLPLKDSLYFIVFANIMLKLD